jgi:hypothetical protein
MLHTFRRLLYVSPAQMSRSKLTSYDAHTAIEDQGGGQGVRIPEYRYIGIKIVVLGCQ